VTRALLLQPLLLVVKVLVGRRPRRCRSQTSLFGQRRVELEVGGDGHRVVNDPLVPDERRKHRTGGDVVKLFFFRH